MNHSDREALDCFGREMIESVRDQSIFEFEAILLGKMKAPSARKMQNELSALDEQQVNLLRKVVFYTIDNVIYNSLNMLVQNDDSMKLLITQAGQPEKNIIEISDGLSGELFTENGWIEKFSKYK